MLRERTKVVLQDARKQGVLGTLRTPMSDRALTLARADSFQVPAIVADVGPEATKRFFEFFTVPVRNKNTRIAYYHAIGEFLDWSQRCGFQSLEDSEPITVAAYIEQHPGSPATSNCVSAFKPALTKARLETPWRGLCFSVVSANCKTEPTRTNSTGQNGLSLVVAAIVLWNTVYLEKAIQKLKRNLSEELLTHLSPLGWEHIKLTGDYVWRPDGGVRNSRRRPCVANLNGSIFSVQNRTNR